jgi:hypothetical protein
MITQRANIRLSAWDALMPLLLVAGAWLWTVPEPDVYDEFARNLAGSFESRVIAEHNAHSSRGVEAVSEMAPDDLARAVSAISARTTNQCRVIVKRVYLAALAKVAAAGCWFTATVSVLVRLRRTRREWVRRLAAGFEESAAGTGPLEPRIPVSAEGSSLKADGV